MSNRIRQGDIDPTLPPVNPLINDMSAEHEAIQATDPYRIQPERLSMRGLRNWRNRLKEHPQYTGPTYPERPTDFTGMVEIPQIIDLPIDPDSPDEAQYRRTVMSVLGKGVFQPDSLIGRFPGVPVSKLRDNLDRMGSTGVVRPGRAFSVEQDHGDSPEAIKTVALHFATVRARNAQVIVDPFTASHTASGQAVNGRPGVQAYTGEEAHAVREQLDAQVYNAQTASNSLDIPIPQMHRILNKLEQMSFLHVPISDRGEDFVDDPGQTTQWHDGHRKLARKFTRYERSGTIGVPVGDIGEQQERLNRVFEYCDGLQVSIREKAQARAELNGGRDDDRGRGRDRNDGSTREPRRDRRENSDDGLTTHDTRQEDSHTYADRHPELAELFSDDSLLRLHAAISSARDSGAADEVRRINEEHAKDGTPKIIRLTGDDFSKFVRGISDKMTMQHALAAGVEPTPALLRAMTTIRLERARIIATEIARENAEEAARAAVDRSTEPNKTDEMTPSVVTSEPIKPTPGPSPKVETGEKSSVQEANYRTDQKYAEYFTPDRLNELHKVVEPAIKQVLKRELDRLNKLLRDTGQDTVDSLPEEVATKEINRESDKQTREFIGDKDAPDELIEQLTVDRLVAMKKLQGDK